MVFQYFIVPMLLLHHTESNALPTELQTVLAAHLVERWTPCGESTRPGCKSPVFEARRALDIYEPPGGYGCG